MRFTADQTLMDFSQKKLNKLDTFHDRIVSAEVFLKLDGAETAKVKDKIVEVLGVVEAGARAVYTGAALCGREVGAWHI